MRSYASVRGGAMVAAAVEVDGGGGAACVLRRRRGFGCASAEMVERVRFNQLCLGGSAMWDHVADHNLYKYRYTD
jgi:hypothetical protein